jgi:hypothetical protein
MGLDHQFINFVVEAVVYAVDFGQPSVPACPFPITDPTLGKARTPDTIVMHDIPGYRPRRPFEVVSGCSHKDAQLDRLVAQAAPELVSLAGIGTDHAATLLIVGWDNPRRFRSEGTFASLRRIYQPPSPATPTKLGDS